MKADTTHDPKKELLTALKGAHEKINVFGVDLLLAIYQRPEKTASGIYLSDRVRGEDIYQGKAGLIIKMGPMAFKDDDTTTPPIAWPVKPDIGDWVLFRVSDGWPVIVGEQHCRIINERGIRMILNRPDVVF